LDGVKQVRVEQSGDAEIAYDANKVSVNTFREALKPYNYILE
jgi:hypothetical protein